MHTANLIFDSSPNMERLIKFCLFYFDNVNLHLPNSCNFLFNIPKYLSKNDIKNYYRNNEIQQLMTLLHFYNEKSVEHLKALSLDNYILYSDFISGRMIARYVGHLMCVKDSNGINHFKAGMTKYELGDDPISRLTKENSEKKASKVMNLIIKHVCSMYNGLEEDTQGFKISENAGLIDRNKILLYKESINDEVEQFLYQYYGYYISNGLLRQYTWFKEYYYVLLQYYFNTIALDGHFIMTDSVLYNLVQEIMSCDIKKINNLSVDYMACDIMLPSLFDLSFESICELKVKVKDELLALKDYIFSLSVIYDKDDISNEIIKEQIKKKINPAINELERKIKNLHINIYQKAIRDIRNPFSYAPMLTSFVSNLDSRITGAVSLGIMGADLALEYLKQKNEIKNDAMYFTLRLNKQIRRKM